MGRGTALAIRFARHGCTNRPFFHLVVMRKSLGSTKKPIEQLGSYDPIPNQNNQILLAINYERLRFWMAKGAEPTKDVEKYLGLSGFLPIHPMTYIDAKRNRKAKEEREAKLAAETEEAEQEAVAQ